MPQCLPQMNSAYSIAESHIPFLVPVLRTFFSWQSSIFGMTNVNLYIVWKAAIAVCIFNHSSPLFSIHPPVCGMASFCFLHAPLSIVSIPRASSSHQNLCGCLFLCLVPMTHAGKQWKKWTCGDAVLLNTSSLWDWCILASRPTTLMQLFQWLWFWQRGNAIILIKHMQD